MYKFRICLQKRSDGLLRLRLRGCTSLGSVYTSDRIDYCDWDWVDVQVKALFTEAIRWTIAIGIRWIYMFRVYYTTIAIPWMYRFRVCLQRRSAQLLRLRGCTGLGSVYTDDQLNYCSYVDVQV